MNALETKIIFVAQQLLAKGPTTTLDIKNECRVQYPNDTFYQADVSDVMTTLAPSHIYGLLANDDGTHKTYYVSAAHLLKSVMTSSTANIVVKAADIECTKKELVQLLRDSCGKFFGITFIKKDGTERTLNGHIAKDNFISDMGYLQIKSNKGEIKQVDPKKIKVITISGNKYVLKK